MSLVFLKASILDFVEYRFSAIVRKVVLSRKKRIESLAVIAEFIQKQASFSVVKFQEHIVEKKNRFLSCDLLKASCFSNPEKK